MPVRNTAMRWIIPILGTIVLAGCRGVLELSIERLPAEPPAPLGQVAYITGGDVWVLDLDGGEPTRITRDGYNRRPRLSPDGAWVAYLKGDQLHVANVLNRKEIKLSDAGISDYAWSPQGRHLAFTSTTGLTIWDAGSQTSRDLRVNLAALNQLVWHPAGDQLAVDNREGSPLVVFTVSLDGQNHVTLFRARGLMDVPRLAGWSPDGHWVALWVGSRAYAAEQDGLPLCFISIEGGVSSCLEERVLLLPDSLSWSPDGRLSFISGGGRETWVGKGMAILEPGTLNPQLLISTGEQAPLQPAWSPDGSHIAYSAGPSTPLNAAYERRDQALQGRQIWLMDIASSRRQQLTSDERYRDERPFWSLDGSHILFARLDNQAASLWLMKADGSSLRQIVSELTPRPDPLGEYGYIDWGNWWDWNRP